MKSPGNSINEIIAGSSERVKLNLKIEDYMRFIYFFFMKRDNASLIMQLLEPAIFILAN